MEVSCTTTFDKVVLIWLLSEWHKLDVPRDRQLIKNPDLTNHAENDERLRLLRSLRDPIIKYLPKDVSPKWVLIEEADLPNLFIVPSYDWYWPTGGTFRLMDTAENLGSYRGDHFGAVNAKSDFMRGYDHAATREVLILVAPSEAGPFTIIDGNHRAINLYLSPDRKSSMPWKGILIDDPLIAYYKWFINSPQARFWLQRWAAVPPPR